MKTYPLPTPFKIIFFHSKTQKKKILHTFIPSILQQQWSNLQIKYKNNSPPMAASFNLRRREVKNFRSKTTSGQYSLRNFKTYSDKHQ